MRTIAYCLAALLCAVTLSSCNYLDKTPDEELTLDDIWANRNYASAFLVNVYDMLPRGGFADPGDVDRNPYAAGSDEMECAFGGSYAHNINSGAWNASNIGSLGVWYKGYLAIRKINVMLANLDKVPTTEAEKKQWRGECYFLRAWFYFEMIRCFGPVILMGDAVHDTGDDFTALRRSPYLDCIDYVVKQCKAAEENLDAKALQTNYGRATAAAAKALKARALLTLASPQFNGNPAYAGYKDNAGTALFPEKDDSRWQDAADAAMECITFCESNGYGLYESADGDPVASCQQLFLDSWNKEIIWARNNDGWNHNNYCSEPRSFGGFTILCPTQEMVDAYEMANGQRPITGYNGTEPVINPASGYVETGYVAEAHPKGYYPAGVRNMYVGREPRFYANVNFAGQVWKNHVCEFWIAGVDGKSGSDYCKTGYLMKKFADPQMNIVAGIFNKTTWVLFRLGEQYLNYAEAANEVAYSSSTEKPSALYYLNQIRKRAGVPQYGVETPGMDYDPLPIPANQAEMREAIRHERRIELAFEGHRFFDVRRWLIAPASENKNITGMDIMVGANLQDDAYYKRTVIEKRIFEDKHYLCPIPQVDINKNENLVQNPQWTGLD